MSARERLVPVPEPRGVAAGVLKWWCMQGMGLSCAHGDSSTRKVLLIKVTHSAFNLEARGMVKGMKGGRRGTPRNRQLFS